MQGFFQFNNSIINEIINFATSAADVLYVSGPKGSGKSETISKAVSELCETNLIFQHFCFENSVIDDFLLNFYDTFKKLASLNKITLKKYSAESFEEKVKHYFKTIENKCIIVIENFENLIDKKEIIDFLVYLLNYKNVKVIAISRKDLPNPFKTRQVIVEELEIEQISKKDFKSKFAILAETTNDELKEKFYNITGGLELYLNMGIKYCNITGCHPNDLVDEFERKRVAIFTNFEEFMVSKFYSLTPATYINLFKTLCTFSHPVSKEFVEEYKLGSLSNINYLLKNFLLSPFKDEVYVKDYFKQYVLKTFSLQERVNYYKNLVDIYEHELLKSPKERLIRLSRESIRKEIEKAKLLIPSVNITDNSKKAFTYLGTSGHSFLDDKLANKSKISEKLNKIKERRNFLSKEKASTFIPRKPLEDSLEIQSKEEDRYFIINLINSAREYFNKYEYQNAINELKRAQEVDFSHEFAIEILTLLAKNYEKLNEFDLALNSYNSALNYALESNDSRKAEIKYQIAVCYKNLYKTEDAKKIFFEIASNENYLDSYRTKSLLEIGEIEQSDLNNSEAIKCYITALSIAQGKDKELTCKSYYKLAVLYDEMQDNENALKYYKKNYSTSSEYNENKYYSVCHTNSALIFLEQGKTREAIEGFKLALQFDSELNDLENMYFLQNELAKIYINIDEISAIGYFKQALSSAQALKDDLKVANVYFEAGELYYDKGIDEKALMSFFNAKHVLEKTANSENISKVNLRIKDIKIRLDDDTFNKIAGKYERQA